MKCIALISAICSGALLARASDEKKSSPEDPLSAALAEGRNGVVVGVTGPMAVHAGLEVLKKGGSAADAAVTTALAQVVECGGCYVSHAGILSMIYYEADTGKVHYLNAGFNTPREEKDPLSISNGGKTNGRTALVSGFMAGVEAAHDRFGKLSRQDVFTPAIAMAEQGFKVSALLAALVQDRKAVLGLRPETKRIFTKKEDAFFAEGEHFCQPELANTLRQVAEQGAAFMYTGAWADQFVSAVQKEGGKITHEDLRSYRTRWEEPVEAAFRGHRVCVPGFASLGGVAMVEALHLLELAELPTQGHYATTPASLFWLMQISNCQVLSYLSAEELKNFEGLDLTARSRVKKESAARIWQRMQDRTWPFVAKLRSLGDSKPPNHSDGVVAVDPWGNVAALTHTINTSSWGETALFVGGISIPDAAALQQPAIQQAGPGNRLPDPMCPLIVLKDGKPVLGSSAIGGGLHQKTLQVLASILDFDMDPQAAVEQPAFLLPAFSTNTPVAQVDRGMFDGKILDAVRSLGEEVREIPPRKAGPFRGYWVGVQIVGDSNLRRGVGTREEPLPSVAEGY